MFIAAAHDRAEKQLLDVANRFCEVAKSAGVPVSIIGGLAAFLHVDDREPIAARLTPEVEVVIRRLDLDRLRAAAEKRNFFYQAGIFQMLDLRPRSAVHVYFVGENVKPDDVEPMPESNPIWVRDLPVAPVPDLVNMKLTSFRLKDKVHIQDMDGLGLITSKIEAAFPPPPRQRLAEVRATE